MDIQSDLEILSDPFNGFGFRADDHASSATAASPLAIEAGAWSASGVIEQNSDVDYFSFDFGGGEVRFVLNVAPYEAMLDGVLSLYNLGGVLLQRVDTATLGETLNANLAAGSYRLAVSSHGLYGDIGQYSLLGTVAIPEPTSTAIVCAILAGFTGRSARRRLARS